MVVYFFRKISIQQDIISLFQESTLLYCVVSCPYMNKSIISYVVAMSKQTRVIGKDNDLLWRIPEDLAHFKRVTMGHPMVMGSKTFDSIGCVLPGRTSIVLTRNTDWSHEDVLVAHSIEEAIEKAKEIDQEEVTIIGGGEVFALGLPYVTRIYLTLVDDDVEGDVYMPEFDESSFTETARVEDEYEGLKYTILTLDKVT